MTSVEARRPRRSHLTRTSLWMGFLMAALGSACDGDDSGPCACTEEFRTYAVTVLDRAGHPAAEVEVAVVRVRDGAVLPYGQPLSAGTYRIMDDGFTDEIARDESFAVGGRLGTETFDASYRFGTDDCRCHVLKLAGPDTVTLRP